MEKVLIFDFDGTIADSCDLIIQIISKYIPNFTKDRYKREISTYYSSGFVKSLFRIFYYEMHLFNKFHSVHQDINKEIVNAKPQLGLKSVLEKLASLDIDMYIISSNYKDNILEFLDKYKMNFFKEVYGDGNIYHKSKTIRKIKQSYGKSIEIFYIGDEIRDIYAARKADVNEVGVTWGINSKEEFQGFNTKNIIDSPEDLLKLIN